MSVKIAICLFLFKLTIRKKPSRHQIVNNDRCNSG